MWKSISIITYDLRQSFIGIIVYHAFNIEGWTGKEHFDMIENAILKYHHQLRARSEASLGVTSL